MPVITAAAACRSLVRVQVQVALAVQLALVAAAQSSAQLHDVHSLRRSTLSLGTYPTLLFVMRYYIFIVPELAPDVLS